MSGSLVERIGPMHLVGMVARVLRSLYYNA